MLLTISSFLPIVDHLGGSSDRSNSTGIYSINAKTSILDHKSLKIQVEKLCIYNSIPFSHYHFIECYVWPGIEMVMVVPTPIAELSSMVPLM